SSPHRDWAAGQPASRNTGQSAALAGARAGHDEAAGGDPAPGDAAYQRQPYSGEPYEGESYQRPPSVRSQSGEWPAADEESRYAAPGRYPLPGEYPLPSQYSRPVRSRQREDSRPAGEQAPEGEPSWPTPDEFSAWPSEQSSGWPPEDPQPGWTSGNGDGDALDPLPRAGKARVGGRSTAGDGSPRSGGAGPSPHPVAVAKTTVTRSASRVAVSSATRACPSTGSAGATSGGVA